MVCGAMPWAGSRDIVYTSRMAPKLGSLKTEGVSLFWVMSLDNEVAWAILGCLPEHGSL